MPMSVCCVIEIPEQTWQDQDSVQSLFHCDGKPVLQVLWIKLSWEQIATNQAYARQQIDIVQAVQQIHL